MSFKANKVMKQMTLLWVERIVIKIKSERIVAVISDWTWKYQKLSSDPNVIKAEKQTSKCKQQGKLFWVDFWSIARQWKQTNGSGVINVHFKPTGCFLVLRKLLLVSFCVVVWVLFSVFSIFCITSLVSATPRNYQPTQGTKHISTIYKCKLRESLAVWAYNAKQWDHLNLSWLY